MVVVLGHAGRRVNDETNQRLGRLPARGIVQVADAMAGIKTSTSVRSARWTGSWGLNTPFS